jgi:hypothetical protein
LDDAGGGGVSDEEGERKDFEWKKGCECIIVANRWMNRMNWNECWLCYTVSVYIITFQC